MTTECLSPEAIDRPRDAQAVTNALTSYLDGVQDRLRRAEVDRASAEARAAEEVNTRRMAEARAAEERRRRRAQAGLAAAVVALVGLASGGAWYQQRQRAATQEERASRRAATAASVAESLVDARRRMAEAWAATSFSDRMNAATGAAEAAVRRAEGYATSGETTEASRAELAAIRAPLADLARHTRLVVDFERTLDGLYNWETEGDGSILETLVSRHQAALVRFGLDPLSMSEDQTAWAIADDPLRDTLIGILSTWQQDLSADVTDRVTVDRLGRVIRLTRLRCGGAYARWQDLLDRKDWKGLAAFAASPEMVSLGPQLVKALARDLSDTALDHEAARDLLRVAVDRYPNAVPIRYDLATSCELMSPPRYREALQQYAAVVALKPKALLFQYRLGATYAALGDYAQAIVVHRKAADRGSIVSAGDMGRIYYEHFGDLDKAIASFRQALATELAKAVNGKGWTATVEKGLGRALRLKALEGRLPGLLSGRDEPGSAAETLDVAVLCRLKRLYTDGTRFYARAFALDPVLADELMDYNRYNAACCAALGAAGREKAAASLDEGTRARLRRQALDWLRADLAVLAARVAGGTPATLTFIKFHLNYRRRDPDLAGIRDAEALARLPAGERDACAKLWADVEALDKKIAEEKPK